MDGWITESLQGVIERMFDLLLDVGLSSPVTRNPNYPGLNVDEGVMQLQNVFNPLILFLTTLGILLAAVRLLWTRRLDPMMDLVRGLLTVIVTTFAGLFLIYVLSGFSDAFTLMILENGQHERVIDGERMTVGFLPAAREVYPSIMRVGVGDNDLGFANETARGAVSSMVGLSVILGLVAQMVVLALLKAIVYLIACLLPLAAASTMVPGLKIFPKVIGWLFACLLYKPLLLMIYLVGLVILATGNQSVQEGEAGLFRYLMGAAIMLLATGALPVLMKLMSSGSVWMMALAAGGVSSLAGGGGGGGGSGGGSGGGGSGAGGGADASPSSANAAPSAVGGAQAAAAGANERAAGVARNLDEGGAGQQPAGDGPAAAGAAGTGAADVGSLGTRGGLDAGTGGPLAGADGPASADGATGGPEGGAQGGGATAAAGATESVSSSTVSGSEQGYSQTVASGAGGDGGSDPGAVADAPAGAGPADTGAVSGGGSGGYQGDAAGATPEGASGAQFADGADGRMV